MVFEKVKEIVVEQLGVEEDEVTMESSFIDDLGAEFMSSFTHATLLNILNTRIYAGKSTLISTNLDDTEALKKTYDDRVVSRLVGEFRQYRFEGNDIRLGKGKN